MYLLSSARNRLEPYSEPDVPHGMLRLHFNENLFLPEEYYSELLALAGESLRSDRVRFYTRPLSSGLARRLEEYHGVKSGSVQVFAGADDAIRSAVMLALHGSRSIAIVEPTYGMASVIASQLNLRIVKLSYSSDLSLDVDSLIKADVDVIYVCSPNNPTGHVVKELQDLAARAGDKVVVVDEAYAEYEGMWRPELYEYGNVIEVRTFSKAWGLAGIRVGYTVANPKLGELLTSIVLPHPISAFSEAVAAAALQLDNYVKRSVEEAKSVRDVVADELGATYRGGNFVTLRIRGAGKLYEWLWSNGVATRLIVGKPLCEECIRITVAPLGVMRRVINLVRDWLSRSGTEQGRA